VGTGLRQGWQVLWVHDKHMAEIFNSILRGVRSLSVTVIASFTFYKCNEWFVKWLVDAQMVQTHQSDYAVALNIF
jgi:hypothetical protein